MELVNRKSPLPVDVLLPEIISSLQRNRNLVVEAPPGAGKTTRVPPSLLGIVGDEVVVLEPRRIAARLAARRALGNSANRSVRLSATKSGFEEAVGPRTRLRFVTEGVLTRRLFSDPGLQGVDAVVLDEFHGRHLDSDFALALLKRLQRTSPDLRIVVMSATSMPLLWRYISRVAQYCCRAQFATQTHPCHERRGEFSNGGGCNRRDR